MRYASVRGLYLKLNYPFPTANTEEGEELPGEKGRVMMIIKEEESRTEEVRQQKWQGKLIDLPTVQDKDKQQHRGSV